MSRLLYAKNTFDPRDYLVTGRIGRLVEVDHPAGNMILQIPSERGRTARDGSVVRSTNVEIRVVFEEEGPGGGVQFGGVGGGCNHRGGGGGGGGGAVGGFALFVGRFACWHGMSGVRRCRRGVRWEVGVDGQSTSVFSQPSTQSSSEPSQSEPSS